MITTTTANLGSRLVGIDESTLPTTFRDLIILARNLGVPYIWIDSLCIIQDSPEDWEREASLMGRVYSSAFCTIAAAASADGNGGLFIERNHLETQICDITDFSHGLPPSYTQEEEDSDVDTVINVFPPRQYFEKLIEQEIFSINGSPFRIQ
ncbi:HET domain pin-c2 protein [Rutstroemia sp. NJR-2017a BVV2]|nr:HET domain pin-c2 protein [Rutstroemia sp. NJR-2017a BVV2]